MYASLVVVYQYKFKYPSKSKKEKLGVKEYKRKQSEVHTKVAKTISSMCRYCTLRIIIDN